MRPSSVGIVAAGALFSFFAAAPVMEAQRSATPSAETGSGPNDPATRFDLTVDSIMKGSDLVGYPPTGLRWSADSQKLYFEWRKPTDKEPSTYVVGRDGSAPVKLSESETKNIPPAAGGRWDKAHRRVLFVDAGDIVVVDANAGVRRQITRTTGAESSPRWAKNDTHVTWVREGNLYIAPVEAGTASILTQLTDVAPRRPEPRLTDSQRLIRDEEEKLIDYVEKQRAERKKAEEERNKNRLPQFELQERQSVTDAMLSPDGAYAYLLIAERAVGSKSTVVPNYVTESGYTEDIPGPRQRRRHPGSAPARRAQPHDRQVVMGRRELRPRRRQAGRDAAGGGGARLDRRGARLATCAGRCRRSPTTASWWSRRLARWTTRIAGWSRSIPKPARPGSSTCCTTTPGSARPAGVVAVAAAGSPARTPPSCRMASGSGSPPSATAGCTSTRSTSRSRAQPRSR